MNIYKDITKLHREHKDDLDRTAIIIGGTGATGQQLTKQLLDKNNWKRVTTISRKPVLNGQSHEKLNDIVIESLHDMSFIKEEFKNHSVFFNCIGTTRKRAGGAKQFTDVEVGISSKAAKIASEMKIPHASLISAIGANDRQWSINFIHPLLYIKTMGEKEQTLIKNNFQRISIFRPGMLIREVKDKNKIKNILHKQGIGLYIDILANAMIRDAESNIISKPNKIAVVYAGNNCIKKSAFL